MTPYLRSSTALATALLLTLQPVAPALAQIAADGTDCAIAENAEVAACVELRGALEPVPAPVEEIVPEQAPVEETVPEQPAEEIVPEEAPVEQNDPQEQPAPEASQAISPESDPVQEAAPALEPEAETAPAAEPEASPETEVAPEPEEQPAPVEQPVQTSPQPAQTADEPVASETSPTETPLSPEPATPPEAQPEQQPAEVQQPASQPVEQQQVEATTVEESTVAPESAPEADPIPEVQAILPSAVTETPALTEPEVAPAALDQISGTGAAAEALRAAGDSPVTSVEIAPPTAIVPDTITDADRARLRAEEEARREEARNRRDVLLGALAAGAVVGALIPALGGTVVEDQGDRLIVERDGEYIVRKDESSLLRNGDAEIRVQRLPRGQTLETVIRRNGVQIVTLRDAGGFIVSRSRILPDGTEIVLIDNTLVPVDRIDLTTFPPPPPGYLVSAGRSDRDVIYRTFLAPPAYAPPRAFTLEEVRENKSVRDLVARVDLDSVTFDTGSAFVTESQISFIADTAAAAKALIAQDPAAILLVEGHTDAVGSEASNLILSDRRAETVARILVNAFGVPAENLIVQGYGEEFLKVNTQGAERTNRRVTLRNISSLVASAH